MSKLIWMGMPVAIALLAGCVSNKPAVVESPPCAFRGTTTPAPGWVCGDKVDGYPVYSVGIFEKSAAGEQFMRDQAIASARVGIAQQFKTKVNNLIDQYVSTTGAASSETVDRVHSSVSRNVTSETLAGTRLLKSAWSPTGALYVLVGMDPAVFQQQAEGVIKTSMRNERALWQQFKAKQGQDELAAEIAKMDAKQ